MAYYSEYEYNNFFRISTKLIHLYIFVIIRLDRIIQGFSQKKGYISSVDSPIKSWNDKYVDLQRAVE